MANAADSASQPACAGLMASAGKIRIVESVGRMETAMTGGIESRMAIVRTVNEASSESLLEINGLMVRDRTGIATEKCRAVNGENRQMTGSRMEMDPGRSGGRSRGAGMIQQGKTG